MYPQMEDSGSEGSTDDEVLHIRDDGYHDAQNDLEAELEEDPERVLSGTLSESSGNAGSDLYDYKVFEGGDSDAEYPGDMENSATKQKDSHQREQHTGEEQGSVYVEGEKGNHIGGGSRLPWEDATSPSTSPKLGVSGPGPGPGPCTGSAKTVNKSNGSVSTIKRPSLWTRNSRLEITKNDLRNKIAKEAKGNAILQALHERRLALEQDVARLQEQLQAERDLRAALEIGLSMSSGQFSSSRSMDSKTRAELEEIALAEADVARLKQKVAELHVQLNQQRQQHFGSLTETGDRYQHVKSLQAQQKVLQQDLDLTLALCQHEKQKNCEGADSGAYQRQPVASSALVELSTRLDFFKERRSQLMEQLHNLDLTFTPASHGFMYTTSPPWTSPQ